MAGGLLQLVAQGVQDSYLTGNPQITFFKAIYRRHTNFALESIRQDQTGNVGPGSRVTYTISRNGDLIHNCWLKFPSKGSNQKGKNVLAMIKSVELEIGGQRIDRHTGDFINIITELQTPESKYCKLNMLLNKNEAPVHSNVTTDSLLLNPNAFYVPLQFFFCKNPGLALPMIALQYHEVKIIIEFASNFSSDTTKNQFTEDHGDMELWVDYIYLDSDERKRFAQGQHDMLIEQVQYSIDNFTTDLRLTFNHPVKELLWVYDINNHTHFKEFGYYTTKKYIDPTSTDNPTTSKEIFSSAHLRLNGQDRFAQRDPTYFRFIQPYQYHTRIPSIPIYMYSFALQPEEHQPSGTCNFSRIDNAHLHIKQDNGITETDTSGVVIKTFAINYNVLRIMSGMGGLAFSN